MVQQLRMGQISTLILLLFSLSLNAQDIHITTSANWGLGYQMDGKNIYEPGFSGAGIRADRIQAIGDSGYSLISGLEFSFQGWGSQVLINNGLAASLWEFGPFNISGKLNILNGMALFKGKILYAGSLELGPQLSYSLKRKLSISLGSGIRYSACPSYRRYGSIWCYVDIPITLGVFWSIH